MVFFCHLCFSPCLKDPELRSLNAEWQSEHESQINPVLKLLLVMVFNHSLDSNWKREAFCNGPELELITMSCAQMDNEQQCVHSTEYYPAIKKNKIAI